MNSSEFQLSAISNPGLSHHATSALPAWLFAIDGSRVLWSNPPGARALGATDSAQLAARTLGPADQHRRQAAQLARRLPPNGALRLERLRGFGVPLGMLATCACARLRLADGTEGLLIAATESAARSMPPDERLQRLVQAFDHPAALFTRDGMLAAANPAAQQCHGFDELAGSSVGQMRDALASGRTDLDSDLGRLTLCRLGNGTDPAVLAVLVPPVAEIAEETGSDEAGAIEVAADTTPQGDAPPVDAMPIASGEAPAEFALFDALADPDDRPADDAATETEPFVTPAAEQPVAAYEQPAQSGEAPAEYALIGEEAADAPDVVAADLEPAAAPDASAIQPAQIHVTAASAAAEQPAFEPRRHPLRFTWHSDADGRFTLSSDEFIRLIGPVTAAHFGQRWTEIAAGLGLDPEGKLAHALGTRSTWSAVALDWPVDGGERLRVELSGLPVTDATRAFRGYRGFGVCRDLAALDRIAVLRRHDHATDTGETAPAPPLTAVTASHHVSAPVPPAKQDDDSAPQPADSEKPVELPGNVVPFRSAQELKVPTLTAVENHAFDELGRQLSFWLEHDKQQEDIHVTEALEAPHAAIADTRSAAAMRPAWLLAPEVPARGASRDRALFDLLPTGVLIYRLDRLIYANAAFLQHMGYPTLQGLEQAGGIDALYVEAGPSPSTSTSEAGTTVAVYASAESDAIHGRLFTIEWDGEPAHALILAPPAAPTISVPVEAAAPAVEAGQANAEDLGAILDMTAEGVIMFDGGGNIHACNRSAEALFAYDGAELIQRNLIELFAPESRRLVLDYLDSVKGAGVESLLEHGREALGRVSTGGIVPLSLTIGRTRPDGPNFFAVFRDLSQTRRTESELLQVRRDAERAAGARADLLARISHEIRAPLNSIIGFADIMLGERFGELGNERYAGYLKDIRSSGERVLAMVNDLQELARIETGKLELAFTNQNLNELVDNCVATMQPQANRERIIIRSSLAQALPSIVADARALRQIALNLIGNSIELAKPGGQVIVSTALNDFGEVVLRVRDTGQRLNEREIAAALEPLRNSEPAGPGFDAPGVNLSLTKALVEANRAQLNIRTAPQSGTMIEVIFPHAMARA